MLKRYSIPEMDIRIILCKSDAEEAQEFLNESILISNDIETIPQLVLMSVNGYSGILASGEVRTYVFPLYSDKNPSMGIPADLEDYIRIMQQINDSGIPFTYHNGPYDLFWLTRYGMPVKNYAYDSMSMFWAIYPELPKRLAFVSSILLDDYQYWKGDRKSDDWTTHLLYNGKDCNRTLRITLKLIEMLTDNVEARINWGAAHRRVITSLSMSMRGMNYSQERVDEHHVTLKGLAESELAKLRYLVADPDFNPNSPQQKIRLLYQVLGASLRNSRGRTVKSIAEASSGAMAMRSIRNDHPIIRRVVDGIGKASEPAKQISNVIGIPKAPWHRVYTSYNGVGTTTSRLSSSEPPITYGTNFQNLRKVYRDWIESDADSVIFEIDLSAGDDVFVSFESGDPEKIKLFRSGLDSHAQNATLFFPSWTYDAIITGKKASDPAIVHPITGIRQITKKLAHGCNYLMAALTLLMTAGRDAVVAAAKEWDFDDAGLWNQERLGKFCEFLESRYRNHYTRFKRSGDTSWYAELASEHAKTGGFTTPFNYYQRFLGSPGDQNVLRALAATAGQAGTAGRINMAMDEIDYGIIPQRFRDGPNPHADRLGLAVSRAEHGISLRLQTHDSLTFNVGLTHPNWRAGVANIFEIMKRPVVIRNSQTGGMEEFVVGIESEVGIKWGKGLHEIHKANDVDSFSRAILSHDGIPDRLKRHAELSLT